MTSFICKNHEVSSTHTHIIFIIKQNGIWYLASILRFRRLHHTLCFLFSVFFAFSSEFMISIRCKNSNFKNITQNKISNKIWWMQKKKTTAKHLKYLVLMTNVLNSASPFEKNLMFGMNMRNGNQNGEVFRVPNEKKKNELRFTMYFNVIPSAKTTVLNKPFQSTKTCWWPYHFNWWFSFQFFFSFLFVSIHFYVVIENCSMNQHQMLTLFLFNRFCFICRRLIF